MNNKGIRVRSVNINALAREDKIWNLFHYFVATKSYIFWIQETRKFAKLKDIKYEDRSNGMAILLNIHRFKVFDKTINRQLIILELIDKLDDQRIIVINVYTNPTYERREPNQEIIQNIKNFIEMARINQKHIIITGDLNQEFNKIKRIFQNFDLNSSKFKYTRPSSLSELDIIATSYNRVKFSTDFKSFMSDHQWIVAKIYTKRESIKDLLQKVTSKKAIQEVISPEYISHLLSSCNTAKEIRNNILLKIKSSKPKLQFSPKYVSIWDKIIKGNIPIIFHTQKIKNLIKGLIPNKTPNCIWKFIKQFNSDLSKKDVCILQGIKENDRITYDKNEIKALVIDYYQSKLYNLEGDEKAKALIDNIADIFNIEDIQYSFTEKMLKDQIQSFPMDTTYGPDLILPQLLKSKIVWESIIQFIIKMLSENRGRLFNETLQGRLILLTKTGSAIAKIQDTRPIVVQNLCTRIIEKQSNMN